MAALKRFRPSELDFEGLMTGKEKETERQRNGMGFTHFLCVRFQ